MAVIVSSIVSFYITWFLLRYYSRFRKYRSRSGDDKEFQNTCKVEAKYETDLAENTAVDIIELCDASESISRMNEYVEKSRASTYGIDRIDQQVDVIKSRSVESDLTFDAPTDSAKTKTKIETKDDTAARKISATDSLPAHDSSSLSGINETDPVNPLVEKQRAPYSKPTVTSSTATFTYSFTFSGQIKMGSLSAMNEPNELANVNFDVNTEPQILNISLPNSKNPMGATPPLYCQMPGLSASSTVPSVQTETFTSVAQSIAQNLAVATIAAVASAPAFSMSASGSTRLSNASIPVAKAAASSAVPLATPDKKPVIMFESPRHKCTSTPESGTEFSIASISNTSAAHGVTSKNFVSNNLKQDDLVFGRTTPATTTSMTSFLPVSPNLARNQLQSPPCPSFAQACSSELNNSTPAFSFGSGTRKTQAFSFDFPVPSSDRNKTTPAFNFGSSAPSSAETNTTTACSFGFPIPSSEANKTMSAFSFGLPAPSSAENKTMPAFSFGSSASGSKANKIPQPSTCDTRAPSYEQKKTTPIPLFFVTPDPTSNENQKDNKNILPSILPTPVAVVSPKKDKPAVPEFIPSSPDLSLGENKSSRKFNCFGSPLSGVISCGTSVPVTSGMQVPGSAAPADKVLHNTTNSNPRNTSNFRARSSAEKRAQAALNERSYAWK